jgi:CO dehydrogenase maturation factor
MPIGGNQADRAVAVLEEQRMKIAVCGKGGSGKSTVTALLAAGIEARGLRVIVIDSDESNSGLYRMLGLESPPVPLLDLVGGKQEVKNVLPKSGPPLPHQQTSVIARPQVHLADIPTQYVAHRDGLQFVSVGKVLHALEGCACPMGVLSREFLKKLEVGEHEVVIVDMEAGVEHFGRGIESGADMVLLVVDPSFESVQLAGRVSAMAAEAGISSLRAVLNRVDSDDIGRRLRDALADRDIDVVGVIPYDQHVFEAGLEGGAVTPGDLAGSIEEIVGSLFPVPGA